MNVVLFLAIVFMSVAAWMSIFVVIPSCTRSLFRYRLWRLRDELVDEIRSGAYFDNKQPHLLIKEIDLGLEAAPRLSLFRLGLAALTFRRFWNDPDREEWFDLSEANAADQERLKVRATEFRHAFAKHIMLGSPSGWVFLAVVFPLLLAITFVDALGKRAAVSEVFRQTKWRVRDEVPFEPDDAVAFLSRHREKQALSRFAS